MSVLEGSKPLDYHTHKNLSYQVITIFSQSNFKRFIGAWSMPPMFSMPLLLRVSIFFMNCDPRFLCEAVNARTPPGITTGGIEFLYVFSQLY